MYARNPYHPFNDIMSEDQQAPVVEEKLHEAGDDDALDRVIDAVTSGAKSGGVRTWPAKSKGKGVTIDVQDNMSGESFKITIAKS